MAVVELDPDAEEWWKSSGKSILGLAELDWKLPDAYRQKDALAVPWFPCAPPNPMGGWMAPRQAELEAEA